MATLKSVISKFRKELKTTYQAQKNIMDVTDRYLTELENAETGGGSDVTVTQVVSTGTKIASIKVDDDITDLYAPNATVTQTVASGTEIAKVDGTSIYIPDAGSVSVTADGSKTYTQLLNQLYALIDATKINAKSIFEMIGSDGVVTVFPCTYVSTTQINFVGSTGSVNGFSINAFNIKSSDSDRASCVLSTSGITLTSLGSSIPTSGYVFKVIY